jgi:putative methanogenesis marker protein 2
MPSIQEIISTVRNYPGILRKRPIGNVVKAIPIVENAYLDMSLIAGFGDDAAACDISIEGEDAPVLLLAADGIMRSLIEKDPYWAGYASVLVNVNDIAAMGGLPLAMVNILCTQTEEVMDQILWGIRDGCSKFGVAMVGGHTHPDGETDSVSVAILGIAKRDCLITSHGAQAGDVLILAFDTDGKITPGIPYSWDTTSHKGPTVVQDQVKAMNILGEMKVVTSGKDLSNPGMLGTVGMLMETCGKGVEISLDGLPTPDGMEFTHWLTVYHGCGFVLTAAPENENVIKDVLTEVGLTVTTCGTVTDDRKVVVKLGEEEGVLFDLTTDVITGV